MANKKEIREAALAVYPFMLRKVPGKVLAAREAYEAGKAFCETFDDLSKPPSKPVEGDKGGEGAKE